MTLPAYPSSSTSRLALTLSASRNSVATRISAGNEEKSSGSVHEHRGEQDQQRDGDVQGDEHVEQHRRQRDDQHHHDADDRDRDPDPGSPAAAAARPGGGRELLLRHGAAFRESRRSCVSKAPSVVLALRLRVAVLAQLFYRLLGTGSEASAAPGLAARRPARGTAGSGLPGAWCAVPTRRHARRRACSARTPAPARPRGRAAAGSPARSRSRRAGPGRAGCPRRG